MDLLDVNCNNAGGSNNSSNESSVTSAGSNNPTTENHSNDTVHSETGSTRERGPNQNTPNNTTLDTISLNLDGLGPESFLRIGSITRSPYERSNRARNLTRTRRNARYLSTVTNSQRNRNNSNGEDNLVYTSLTGPDDASDLPPDNPSSTRYRHPYRRGTGAGRIQRERNQHNQLRMMAEFVVKTTAGFNNIASNSQNY